MTESAAAGLPPHLFWGYAPRETYALLRGAGLRSKYEQARLEANAWKTGYYSRVKKLPPFEQIMRPFRPKKVMSRKSMRRVILSMAEALGAQVVHRPRRPPKE